MIKHKFPKSLTETWKWKNKVYNMIKDSDNIEKYFEENTKDVISRLGLEIVSYNKKV